MAKPNYGKKSKNQRRTEGDARNEAWRSLSPTEQLKDLDRRLGKGVGAKRQRQMIEARLVAAQPAPPKATEPKPEETSSTPNKKKFKKGNKKRS